MGVVPGALLGITENIVRVLELLEGGRGLGVVGSAARRLGDLSGWSPVPAHSEDLVEAAARRPGTCAMAKLSDLSI
ncbi:unnamed protein product [Spirodela intermedia]|uniref:Uncharacterized protein n=1 Tax=Spirodela intermedia TaxID=51605 RepID=A0A7I8IHN4_SPIIN|nr:unnamed protein product [Spirodela intermedia]CAA6657385.1 unnamed protein product [Spirodela intermedia]